MMRSEMIVALLKGKGELWEPSPGLLGVRGETLARLRDVEAAIAMRCRSETRDEWLVPQALPVSVLARADYFASFPQWLSLATHLTNDPAALERIATSAERDNMPVALAAATARPNAALPPAVCYHVYSALAETIIDAPRIVTAQGCCWRHEAEGFAPLARGWAFTMREIVCIGTEAECIAFRDRGIALAHVIAKRLGVQGDIVPAEDPFFAPTGRGRALLQRLKELKQELRLPIGDGETIAAASFNLHERFFGEAFDIRLADGTPAFTACVAFGLERWLLASLIAIHADALEEVLI